MKFAAKLKQFRDARGWTESHLAKQSGVSLSSIRNYAMGRRAPSFEAVVKLARALGVGTEDFAACEFPSVPQTRPKPKGRKKS
jgi:transcriptional regulator with XRE-family HTH domain